MTSDPPRAWETLTTAEIEEIAGRDPVVVLPLAAVEQHGPHLPLSTDIEIGSGLLRGALASLPRDLPVFALPMLPVGASAEHLDFPGTLSLDPELLTAFICEIGSGLAGSGVRRLVLFNSHGGNRAAIEAAGLRLRREEGLLVVKATYFDFPRPSDVELPESEWRHGLHGGAVETSMLLYLRPDLVRTDRFEAARSLGEDLEETLERVSPSGAASFSWLAEDLHPSGITGDPTLADARKGALLVEHYAGILAEIIRDAGAFPVQRLG